jgi:hypothetical protein
VEVVAKTLQFVLTKHADSELKRVGFPLAKLTAGSGNLREGWLVAYQPAPHPNTRMI